MILLLNRQSSNYIVVSFRVSQRDFLQTARDCFALRGTAKWLTLEKKKEEAVLQLGLATLDNGCVSSEQIHLSKTAAEAYSERILRSAHSTLLLLFFCVRSSRPEW